MIQSCPQPESTPVRVFNRVSAAILFALDVARRAVLLCDECDRGVAGPQGDTVIPETFQTIPVFQIAFARYAVAALVVLPFMFARRSRFQMSSPPRYLVRTLARFDGIVLMFFAIQTVPLASETAIGFTSPIFAMVLSVLLLQERVPKLRWAAAALGLFGALIIASPGSGVPITGAAIALAAAVFMGAEIVSVKWLAQTRDGAVTILFYSNLTGVLVSGAFMITDFVWPTFDQAMILALVGSVAILGQACFFSAASGSLDKR